MRIPNKIHAVWLGNVLNEMGRINLAHWKEKNKDHQVYLWIDSSLFSSEHKKEDNYQTLINWAKKNNIILADLALDAKKSDEVVQGKSDFLNRMLSQEYYLDEINGRYKNLAAASDILRAEILYQMGGIYIDVKDIFPGEEKLDQLEAKFGFLHHMLEDSSVNNDLLASIPKGTIIKAYRDAIQANYEELYKKKNKLQLYAHRNPQYASPLKYAGSNPRKQSTLELSGPGAMDKVLRDFQGFGIPIPEAKNQKLDNENVSFPKKSFKIPPEQAGSWYDAKADQKLENVMPIFRNYIKIYFNNLIDSEIKNLSESKKPLGDNLENSIKQLELLKKRLFALPLDLSMSEVYKSCIEGLNAKEIENINQTNNSLLEKLLTCSTSSEKLIALIPDEKAEETANMLKNIGVKVFSKYQLTDFINDVLMTKNQEPDLEKLEKYDLEIHSKSKKPSSL